MKLLTHIPQWVKNKYFLASVVFVVWLLFFDRNDLFTQYQRQKELKSIKQSSKYYTEEIAAERKFVAELKSNPAAIEKLAREKYMMKRDDEDLFLIKTTEK
ncbi:MAG: septum formation initiator family protein [Chitinophagaceae bacterium]|nr:septum formation initiator family protein [Chitinophagaceae bacterium]